MIGFAKQIVLKYIFMNIFVKFTNFTNFKSWILKLVKIREL